MDLSAFNLQGKVAPVSYTHLRAQHNGHQAEQAELGASLAAANHADAHREHGDQIEDIENGFNLSLIHILSMSSNSMFSPPIAQINV